MGRSADSNRRGSSSSNTKDERGFLGNGRLLALFLVTRAVLPAVTELQRMEGERQIEAVRETGRRLCQVCQADAR